MIKIIFVIFFYISEKTDTRVFLDREVNTYPGKNYYNCIYKLPFNYLQDFCPSNWGIPHASTQSPVKDYSASVAIVHPSYMIMSFQLINSVNQTRTQMYLFL